MNAPYNVKELATAEALQAFWAGIWKKPEIVSRLGIADIYQLVDVAEPPHPFWREINDAFISGRLSALRDTIAQLQRAT